MGRTTSTLIGLLLLVGCGARTGLDDGQAPRPSFDAGTAEGGTDGAEPPGPSCRSLPNCLEAELVTPTGEILAFASEGEVTVLTAMGRGVWLETPWEDDPAMAVQVDFEATPGPVELSLNFADFYVDLRLGEENCNVRGEGNLERVDLAPGGVTEGTFAGATRDLCGGGVHQVRQGWFRLTRP